MNPEERETMRKKALLLLEDGRYQESLDLCNTLMTEDDDPSLPVLAATDLFYMEMYDEAELHFRDLARRIPDSSYIHSFIGKILDKKQDERAITEFALAVSLDPRNQDALRSYAIYLVAIGDMRRALPVLRKVVDLSGKEEDVRTLMRALLDFGEGEEALALHAKFIGERGGSVEYIDALNACGKHLRASQVAERMYREYGNILFLKKQLSSLAATDPVEANRMYASIAGDIDDPGILEDYVRLLINRNEAATALAVCRSAKRTGDAIFLRLECTILSSLGGLDPALAAYEAYLQSDTAPQRVRGEDRESAIMEYRELLMMHFPIDQAAARFVQVLSGEVNADNLLAIAGFYEDLGDPNEARSWYYRAYRIDYFKGGLAYAKFLMGRGDTRETGKVLLYVFNNTRKASDIVKAGRLFINFGMHATLPRVLDRLLNRLLEMSPALSSEGLELLAVTCLVSAASALEAGNYAKCKQYCLRGLDVVPGSAGSITPGDFLPLVDRCKQDSIVDIPVMEIQPRAEEASESPADFMARIPDLTEQERKIIEYLKVHRQANEMDLRQLLGTRRVVGVVNQLIRKAAARRINLLRKQGAGDYGEIYEYTGP
jgi:tetratricopeptide (TPR) repeat protein